jgi:pimeloyl-ACP methyl ester carboxylesterase
VTERPEVRHVWLEAADGTQLYALDVGDQHAAVTPLVCLAGLTRNHRDFEPVFEMFAHTRRIVAPDYRGRGKSGFAADSATYNPTHELQDALLLLDHLDIKRAAFIGVSRGGIIGLMMANLHQARIAGLLLVDIGPELEIEGLRRISGYAGKTRSFRSWADAAANLANISSGFSHVSNAQWLAAARRIFQETNGLISTAHDPEIANSLPDLSDATTFRFDLWPLMPALAHLPCALLYGMKSDLLSESVVRKMASQLPLLQITGVPDRGHVPFLDERESVESIDAWLSRIV